MNKYNHEIHQPICVDEESLMNCLVCGEATGFHIDSVTCGVRQHEDASVSLVTVDGTNAEISVRHLGESPEWSGRRQWFELNFWCEHCVGRGSLIFAQCKGVTQVYLVRDSERAE